MDANVLQALDAALSAETEDDAEAWLAQVLEQLADAPRLRGPVSSRLMGSTRSSLYFGGAEIAAEDQRSTPNVLNRLAEGLWAHGARETSQQRRERLMRLPPRLAARVLRLAVPLADQDELSWVASISHGLLDPILADALLLAISKTDNPAVIQQICRAAASLLRDSVGHRLRSLETLAWRRPDLAEMMVEAAVESKEPRTVASVAMALGGTLLAAAATEKGFSGALSGLLSLPQSPARDHALSEAIDSLGPVRSRRVYDGVCAAGAQADVGRSLALRVRRAEPEAIAPLLRRVAELHPPSAAHAARGHLDHDDRATRVYCIDVLGRCGTANDLRPLRAASRGIFLPTEVKDAAIRAIDAIEERSRAGGELSIAPQGGNLTIAVEESGLALDEG